MSFDCCGARTPQVTRRKRLSLTDETEKSSATSLLFLPQGIETYGRTVLLWGCLEDSLFSIFYTVDDD